MKTVRGVLLPAFQMAVDDDCLQKNPFGFELAGVVVNDSVTREAITRDQMRKFLKFVHDDNCYCKYYEAVYILFHTGMRISEFCGLTISDLDMENRIIDINHQLQRSSAMEYYIESTKTNAGTRKIPMTEEVYRCFQAIIEDREAPRFEKMVDGYTGFLYLDDQGMPLVAMHWPPHLLQQPGESRDEPEDAAVPDGAQRYRGDAQRVHAPGAGGRSCGDGQDGGGRDSEKRAGEDLWKEGKGEHSNTENVQSVLN